MDTTASVLTFSLSEEASLLRMSVRQLLADSGAQEAARRFWEDDRDFDRELWKELAAMGIAGMAAPEALGGVAAPWSQLALVSEELGVACAAVPFEMQSLALVLLGQLHCSSATADLARAAVAGERVVTAALNLPTVSEAVPPRLTPAQDGRLSGQLALVLEGAVADAVVAPVGTDGVAILVEGFEREHVASLGMNRLANLTMAGALPLQLWTGIGEHERRAQSLGALLYAARQSGMGEWLLGETTKYAAERVQFGRPIGSFQAIQHKLAEMHIALAAGRFLVRFAASRGDAGADVALDVARAKSFLDTAMWQASTEAHQIHGGVGFVLDHPLHLYFAQSRGAEAAFGAPRRHHREVGRALLKGDAYRPNVLIGG